MHRMHRAAGVVSLAVLLAACAAPGTGGGSAETPGSSTGAVGSTAASANPSASESAGTGTETRVDISALGDDPSSFIGEQITVLARVDQVLVDGAVFLTSPSASEEGQIAVIIRPDAQVDKEIVEGSVVWVSGSVIGLTEDELQQAGVDVSLAQLGDFQGEFAIVADAIRDPLAAS